MGAQQKPVAEGLEGIVVAETTLSEVEGERGRLIISGYDVEHLGGKTPFESVLGLLWTGTLPNEAELRTLRTKVAVERVHAFKRLEKLTQAFETTDGMEALRSAISMGVPAQGESGDGFALTAAMAVFSAAWHRRRAGLPPIAPNPELSHSADYLRMVTGETPSSAHAEALDAYLVTVRDHGMNASTFTARVVTSTGSDAVSSVVSAICALKGPLHGGAPGPVLDMLDAIGSPEHAAAWVESELAAGRRIMGMGHRIYRVRDPRAAVLEKAIERLEKSGAGNARLQLARAVEKTAEDILKKRHPDRALRANVEFYTAVLLDALGLDRTLFSPTFSVGRIAGWYAHILEQRRKGRLIRPSSRYIGSHPQ